MRVTVHYFAALRDRKGLDHEVLEVEEELTLRDLFRREFPPETSPPPVLYVLGEAYVSGETPLVDGAEIAFLPPLGGG